MIIKRTGVNKLIEKIIRASLAFEEIIDLTDFNSYLPKKQEEIKVVNSSGYNSYKANICKASKVIKNVKISIQMLSNIEKSIKNLCINLFNAKQIRLEARKQIDWNVERMKYEECSIILISKLISLINLEKGNNKSDYKLLKVLFNNELAICYSGYKKTSLSLGYSEESINILEGLIPELKRVETLSNPRFKTLITEINETICNPAQFIGLYTFALINKGEAQRTSPDGSNYALKIFQRVIYIYRKSEKQKIGLKDSDCKYALLRMALILVDQGRGKEAINHLRNKELIHLGPSLDYRSQQRDLEIASALIDQKEFKDAWNMLLRYSNKKFQHTFTFRQAQIHQLRLLIEFWKNRPEDFQASENLVIKESLDKLNFIGISFDKNSVTMNLLLKEVEKNIILEKLSNRTTKGVIENLWKKLHSDFEVKAITGIKIGFSNFEESAIETLRKSIERKDGDSFKGACTRLAEFYRLENTLRNIKDNNQALKYFYFYLFENKILKSELKENDINVWLENDNLKSVFKNSQNYAESNKALGINDDENYLRAFFDTYIDHFIHNENSFASEDEKATIIILKERLDYVYQLKDKESESEQIERKFEQFEGTQRNTRLRNGKAEEFIKESFFENKSKGMSIESISNQMERNTEGFIEKVIRVSNIPTSNSNFNGTLTVLRRWNSFTPTLGSSINKSKGGGYFIHFSFLNESFGIVIDPGYNFLENFFSQGFTIGDIDLVLVSHAHPDHTDDLTAILSLFHERNGRLGEFYYKRKTNKRNPTLIISSGVFEQYKSIISSNEEELKDIVVLDGRTSQKNQIKFKINNAEINIKAFGTSHKDLSQFQSLGFIISMIQNSKPTSIIGYTGDIKWRQNKSYQYIQNLKKCNIICVHLGSIINIINHKNFCNTYCYNSDNNNCFHCDKKHEHAKVTKSKLIEQTRQENHLYLAGLVMFFNALMKEKNNNLKLVVLSEFGEELKDGIRFDLYKKLNIGIEKYFNKSKGTPICLPGDVGLEIDVFTHEVYCHCCRRYVDRANIVPVPYGEEEAIYFVCKECFNTMSTFQIDNKLRELYENGRRLELVVENI